jgi:RNA polymerase sigma-70 factor (ECF subfamily)
LTGSAAEFERLLDSARRGETAAQGDLLGRYRNYLALLARLSLARELRAKIDDSDIVQDVLPRAHQGIGQFRGTTEAEMVVWLRRILANRLADLNRRSLQNQGRAAGREVPIEAILDRTSASLGGLPLAPGTSPSRGAQRREVATLIADALAAMKEDDREVIVLRSLEGLEWTRPPSG